jgi:hypothetical protein
MKPKSQNSGIREGLRRPPCLGNSQVNKFPRQYVTFFRYGLILFVPSYNNVFNVKKLKFSSDQLHQISNFKINNVLAFTVILKKRGGEYLILGCMIFG